MTKGMKQRSIKDTPNVTFTQDQIMSGRGYIKDRRGKWVSPDHDHDRSEETIRADIMAYTGSPFLVGECARDLGVNWHRMKRIITAMVGEGSVVRQERGGWTFYRPKRHLS